MCSIYKCKVRLKIKISKILLNILFLSALLCSQTLITFAPTNSNEFSCLQVINESANLLITSLNDQCSLFPSKLQSRFMKKKRHAIIIPSLTYLHHRFRANFLRKKSKLNFDCN